MAGQVIWMTGLSGAGKTTVSTELNERLKKSGLQPILLDGDSLRSLFIESDSTKQIYTRQERIKLSYKYSHLCQVLSSQGSTVIIATVSMFREIYAWNRLNLPNYFEIYLDVPLKELCRRDPKNIYSKFYSGEINNVAGLDLKVDQPQKSNLTVKFKSGQASSEIVDIIFGKLTSEGIFR